MIKSRSARIILAATGVLALFFAAAACMFLSSIFRTPDLKDLPPYHPFKSQDAKQRYLEHYDNREAGWPVPAVSRYIDTSYGKTYVRICGPETGPVLVLLPSLNSSSLIWMPNIYGLASVFRIYAVDNIYDSGRSIYSRALKNADDETAWLDPLFDGLSLKDNINLAGLSFGGWATAQYALKHPEKLSGAALVAPAGTIINLPGEFAWRGILSAIPHRWFMDRFMVGWLFGDLMKQKDPAGKKTLADLSEDAILTLKCFKMKMAVTPTVLSDTELSSFQIPVMFLVGENEKIYPAGAALERLKNKAPGIRAELIGGAGHDLTIVKAEEVNRLLIDFFTR